MRRLGAGIRAGVRRLFVPSVGGARRSLDDMEAEVRAHVDARIEHLVARGMSLEAARAEAERRFGGMDRAFASLRVSAASRERRLDVRERLRSVAQDLRFVLRGLRGSPAFTVGVIATLALGLGINSAVFRIADRVLLRAPEGVARPGSLRRVLTSLAGMDGVPTFNSTMSYGDARTLADGGVFEGATLFSTARMLRSLDGRDVPVTFVDSGFFRLLGVTPAVGRLFDARETRPGAEEPVAVISHAMWRREFGGAPPTDGMSITLASRAYRIVGVTPAGFTGVDLDPIDVWLPLGVAQMGRSVVNGVTIPWWQSQGLRPMRVIARLAPGVATATVEARANTVLSGASPESRLTGAVALRPITGAGDATTDATSRIIARLGGVALVVLLIAAANAANLLLARALRRRREIAVRVALGGSRSRVMRLLLLESTVLGLLGGAAAALGGYWTGESLRRLVFPDARWTTSAFDDRTLVFTLLAALVAGLAAGFAPATQLSNPDVVSALKGDTRRAGRGSRLTRTALVLTQTAFSLALLIASGLLVRSLYALNSVRIGIDPADLVTASVPNATRFSMALGEYAGPRVTADEVARRIAQHPDVRAVALASNVPFGATAGMDFRIPGRTLPDLPPLSGPYYSIVSANYFAVMGTRVVRGRPFIDGDAPGSQAVALINESMAKTFWPDADPFQSCLLLPGRGVCAKVVGVVEDVRDSRGLGSATMRYYLPIAQMGDSAGAVLVRANEGRAAAVAAAIRSAVPTQQRPQIEVIGDRVARALRPWRLATLLFSGIGVIALALACVGVYSVMTYVASERVRELGIRMVLGATPSDVARLVATSGLRLVAVGAAIGVLAAAVGSRLLAALLFGVSPFDPLIYGAAIGILCAMGLAATLMPALRVMRTDPTVALRAE